MGIWKTGWRIGSAIESRRPGVLGGDGSGTGVDCSGDGAVFVGHEGLLCLCSYGIEGGVCVDDAGHGFAHF